MSFDIKVPEQYTDLPDFYNIIYLHGDIHDELAAAICERLFSVEARNKYSGKEEPITMIINSPGGEVYSAFAICDMMDMIDTPVYTVGSGMIASSASMILMNGEPGHRVLTSRSTVLSHQFSSVTKGTFSDISSTMKNYNDLNKKMQQHYEECTGLDIETIQELLLKPNDAWLTPREAKKYNIVDDVIETKKDRRLKKNKKAASRKKAAPRKKAAAKKPAKR